MKLSTGVCQPFNKVGLQCSAGFGMLCCWSTLPAKKVFQSSVIKLQRNMRISLTSGQGLGADCEAKGGTPPGLQWRFMTQDCCRNCLGLL